ncbi:hypothetical protein BT63DRAFT_484434 [Microthyrium microscopicum]|uniref:Nucleotide-diphospho-sugar transferase domain-containing protein n=1 Tax=Microthyrium microscopicum TaxID=703497 RepID=A0A6A6TWX7_9PEZI|nr:hypothetical protein BT63DRAFT_484434 [Microthyrium microscopicum]
MMLPSGRASFRRATLFTIASLFILSLLWFKRWRSNDEKITQSRTQSRNLGPMPVILRQTLLADLIRDVYSPHVLPVNEPFFRDYDGNQYSISENPTWQDSIGHRLCIIDFDTKPLDYPNEAFSWTRLDYSAMGGMSPGIFNHYLYAMIHGYTYHYIRTSPLEGRAESWGRVAGMASSLFSCDVIVALDPDYVFQYLDVPYEWLMNRWNITKDTAVAMPLGSPKQGTSKKIYNKDSQGRLAGNTDFVTVRRIEQVFGLLEAWQKCPDEKDYPGCKRFANQEPNEKGAFAEYIRYGYADTIVEFPCDESAIKGSSADCQGVFVRHHGANGMLLKEGVTNSIMQSLFDVIHTDMLKRQFAPIGSE